MLFRSDVKSGDFTEAFTCQERYVVTGEFSYGGSGDFGFAFDYNGKTEKYKFISFSPEKQTLGLTFNNGTTEITQIPVSIEKNKKYTFNYLQEGSIGVFYFDGQIALTVRIYGVSGKAVRLYAKNNNVSFENLKQYTYL